MLQHCAITLPEAILFSTGNVVSGSVIQLYCTADSVNATFQWTLNGDTLLNDPPHIRIRSSSDSSTSTSSLIVDNFQEPDNGTYLCTADTMASTNGTAVTLTGIYIPGSNNISVKTSACLN